MLFKTHTYIPFLHLPLELSLEFKYCTILLHVQFILKTIEVNNVYSTNIIYQRRPWSTLKIKCLVFVNGAFFFRLKKKRL